MTCHVMLKIKSWRSSSKVDCKIRQNVIKMLLTSHNENVAKMDCNMIPNSDVLQ